MQIWAEGSERLVRIMKEIRSFNETDRYAIANRIAELRETRGYKSMEMAHFMDIHRSTLPFYSLILTNVKNQYYKMFISQYHLRNTYSNWM